MPVNEDIGLDDLSGQQEIWRFMPTWKAMDLFRTSELYLRRVSDLRLEDPHESRLPAVLVKTLTRLPLSQLEKDFMIESLRMCEEQAACVFASCWFLPGSRKQEARMWRTYGGSVEGGIVVTSSIDRLRASLPDDIMLSFGIGSVRYVHQDIDFMQAFRLDEYRSAPFLLKLSSHQDDREIRLYQRYGGALDDPHSLRTRVDCRRLIRTVRISPLCSPEKRAAIYSELTGTGLPKSLFEHHDV